MKREPKFVASRTFSENVWFVRCKIHGDFENTTGRCFKCDETSAHYTDVELWEDTK